MNKRVTAIGLTAGLLAGAGAGLILEMSGNAGAASNAAVVTVAPDDTTTDDTGTADDTAAADPAGDHTARLQEVLQPLVADGTLTQDQLDKVITALESAGPMGRPDGGRGDQGGRGGMGRGLDTVATLLGLTVDDLRTAIEGGQTIAQIAEANGSSAQAVIDALVAEVQAHFDEEVAAGEHTQEDADARIADATTRITDMVNNTQTAGPGGLGGPGGRGRGPGHDGDDNGDGADASGTTGTGGSIDGGPSDTPTSADA
ncbi:MAG: hypothetical protein HY828_05860 [Actinobacteria bacterium]|nr:hypothetical protein [Actinomycetota bacterium]